MNKIKKFSSVLSVLLTLSVILGNFSLSTALAYEKRGIDFEQVRIETSPDSSGAIFNKISSLSKEAKSFPSDLSITEKGRLELGNSRQAEENKKDYVEGEILIKYKKNKINLETSSGRVAATNFAVAKSMEKREDIRKNNISVLKIKDGKTVEQKIAELKNDLNVEYVQPNFQYYPSEINTNDTNKALLWGLDNTGQLINGVTGTNDADINAPEAWAINEGINGAAIVAVIDSGVAYNHPDLVANMWDGTNCKHENGNSLGSCNHGYDYEDGDKTPLPTTSSHGTHIAGTIVAIKNNSKGIIGVAPQAKIMAIKSSLTTDNIIKSINFAQQNGAKVINASWGGSNNDLLLRGAIETFTGLFVAAAGNGEEFGDPNVGDNHDSEVHLYPSDYDLENIISVAATDQNDNLASFSDYGATSVDVGAPGTNIYSTVADTISFSENFEGSTYNVGVGGSTTNHWVVGHDGSSMVAYSDKTVPYEASAHTWLMSKNPIDLSSSNIKGAALDFTIWCDTPISATFDDYILTTYYSNGSWYNSKKYDELQIYLDGGLSWIDSGHVGYYKNYTEDISSILSSDFGFSFDWITNSSIDNNLGCTIDNIKITKYSDGSDEKYDYGNGTSMAASHVAGLAALIEGYNPNLTTSQVKNIILTTGDSLTTLSGKTVSGARINAQKALQAATPLSSDMDITAFDFPEGSGVITGTNIAINVPFGTNVTALVPTIVITGASVSPASGIAQNFTGPVTYTVTAADGSTQTYTVTVTVESDPDTALVAADKAALVDSLIQGENIDLSHITTTLTNPLPASGSNSSTITWASSNTEVISNDGQTVNRPDFASGDVAVTLTATLTKGLVTDTKVFNLTVLKLPASSDATVTSATYTVSTGGTASETITDVPFGTAKATFLAALTKGQADQIWNDTDITDPVVTGNTLVVTAQDGVTIDTYTVTVNAPVLSSIAITTPADKLEYTVGDLLDITGLVVTGTYSDGSTAVETITTANITGFDSSSPVTGQVLTITVGGKTTTYTIDVVAAPDIIPPVITLLGDNPVNLYVGDSYTDAGATALDDVDGDITADIAVAGDVVDVNTAGTYTITYNVSDAAGNLADEVTRTVNVSEVPDTTAPVITAPIDQTFEATGPSTTPTLIEATALDNVDPNPVITYDIHTFPVGNTIVTWTATDASGNSATTTSNVTITDTTAPVITGTPTDINVEIVSGESGAVVNYTNPTAADFVDGSVVVTCDPASGSTFPIGDTTVTCTATDVAGNTANSTFKVTVIVDTTPPIITLLGDNLITIEVGTTYNDAGATASDDKDGNITGSIVIVNSVDSNILGSYTVTYNVSDSSGNPATEVIRTVNVVDTALPVITLLGDNPINISVNTNYDDAGATANDNYDGDITNNIVTVNPVDVNIIGTYYVTYNVVDSSGNSAIEIIRTVNIVDISTPIISLLGDNPITIEVGTPYTDAGATAIDDVDGDISGNIVVVNNVNSNILGTYTVTYNVFDSSGNHAPEAIRTVNVVDTTAPTITAPIDQTFEATGPSTTPTLIEATAIDVSDPNPTITYTPHSFLLGDTNVTWTATDASGNTSTATSRVTIIDTTGPTIAVTSDITTDATSAAGAVVTYTDPTATDLVDGSVVVTCSPVSGSTFPIEDTTITCTAIDAASNTATSTFKVTVQAVLDSIAITTPATKLVYTVGDSLDITGLVVTGTYNDGSTKVETITTANITGFNSSAPVTGQVLTITVDGKTTTYTVNVNAATTGGGGGGGATTPPSYTTGDINKDNKVDKYDFSMMMAAWGKTGSNTSDLNGDNKVDKYDFALLMSKWSI